MKTKNDKFRKQVTVGFHTDTASDTSGGIWLAHILKQK